MNFFTVAQSVPNDTFEKVHRHMLRPREHATRFSSPIHMYSNDLVWACAQDMAHLLETVVYERAKCMVGMRAWEDVAADISLACEEKGIGMLCTADQAASVAVKLTRRALSARFEKCAKAKAKLTKMREKAIQYISRTQLYLPPEGMSLWLYFQTQEHTIISRKSIGRKDQIARDTKENGASRGIIKLLGKYKHVYFAYNFRTLCNNYCNNITVITPCTIQLLSCVSS